MRKGDFALDLVSRQNKKLVLAEACLDSDDGYLDLLYRLCSEARIVLLIAVVL